jgi:hypothetical protein
MVMVATGQTRPRRASLTTTDTNRDAKTMVKARNLRNLLVFIGVLLLAGCAVGRSTPQVSRSTLPAMAWDHRPEAAVWTRATLAALAEHGRALINAQPGDIAAFCPAYPRASDADRAAFWAGLLSILAKHESTWRPEASGGGGAWIGLTQIDPRTARGYRCDATTSAALKNGAANLSCAVRIAAAQVGADQMLVAQNGNWRGMARDWAPFRDPKKRQDMANWTRAQAYCQA